MSSSEHSSSESDETGNESLPDLHKLKPYDLEPRISSSDLSSSSNGNSDSETAEESRIGNVDWCLCGKCLPMTSYTESISGWPAAGKTWKILENPGKWKGVLENLENDSFWSKILEKQGFLKTVLEFFQ